MFERDVLHVLGLAERDVRFAIGHIQPEPSVLDQDLVPRDRIGSKLLDRGLGTPPLLGFGEELRRAFEGDREDLILRFEAACLLPPLDEGPVSAVQCKDLRTVLRMAADNAGKTQKLHCLIKRDRCWLHRLEQRSHLGFGVRVGVALAELHVRPEPADLHEHLESGVRLRAQ